ncbi:MAG: T9SS type A sorting domain-containing protein [Burkholderiales bacterium]|nr:T9SS type A sorting domain-containing protein [Bacteroidia bacterium]
MKTIKQTILAIALCVISITTFAQCPNITSINTQLGANGTATLSSVFTGTVSPLYTAYYWQMTPNTGQNNAPGQAVAELQFPANGTYSVCATISDSLNGCWSNYYCTTITITNMAPSNCNASFIAYTDSNCVTYFSNTSIGNALTYEWNINGVTYTTTNPSVNLPNGNYPVLLQTYYAGQPCDSAYQTVTVGCSGTNTVSCVANFTSFTDTSCVTHLTNTSTGTNLTYEWYDITNMSNPILMGTTANLSLNLPQGYALFQLATFSNGTFCDSATNSINVNCGNPANGCQAVSQFVVFPDSVNPSSGNYYAYNSSYGSGTTSYIWSFGDGASSTQQYPFHQYGVPGQYIICLTVNVTYTTALGTSTCTDSYCDSSSVQKMAAGFLMSQMNVIPQTVTGIKHTEQLVSLNAYPNPVADELTIESSSADNKLSYILIDALGRNVLTGSIENSKVNIYTGSLEKGFYNLSITNEKGNALKTVKLVK